MSPRTINVDERLYQYILDNSLRESEVQKRLRAATADMEWSIMQISPEQGQFMALLVKLTQAKRIIEIGTFTGYSALSMALALPDDGQIVCCDVSDEWTSVGVPFWHEAGVADQIDLKIAPALETLDALCNDDAPAFDMAFIDADKDNYVNYYERCLALVRPGGLIMFDNVLWNGSVANPEKNDTDTNAIRELNAALHHDPRIDLSLVPIGDGLTLARVRDE